MVSARALHELGQFANVGRLGGRAIALEADQLQPEPGAQVTITWRAYPNSRLRIGQAQPLVVGANGQQSFRIGGEPVVALLESRGIRRQLAIEPRIMIPRIDALSFQDSPMLGEVSRVVWRTAGAVRAELEICQDGQSHKHQVEPEGEMPITPVSAEPLILRLKADSQHIEWTPRASAVLERRYNVAIPRPTVSHFVVPRRVEAGAPVVISWSIEDAVSVRLVVSDGGALRETVVDRNGETEFVADIPGRLTVRLVAVGRHAALSERASTVVERTVAVFPPQLTMDLLEAPKSVPVGQTARFAWQVSGARSVRLQRLATGEVFDVPAEGAVEVEASTLPEQLLLIATGYDGNECAKRLELAPDYVGRSTHDTDIQRALRALEKQYAPR